MDYLWIMHELQGKLKILESNVIALIRKLDEHMQNHTKLKEENKRLKEELLLIEGDKYSMDKDEKDLSYDTISKENLHQIKSEIAETLIEVDRCIELINNK